MGFILFTESGTFNPATYGLKAGDSLHVKVVGGGGGGGRGGSSSNDSHKGAAGSASSFGSVLTAAGGLPGGPFSSQTFVKGSNVGGRGGSGVYLGITYYYAGTGGDGWMPGYHGTSGIPPFLLLPHSIGGVSTSVLSFDLATEKNRSYMYANREFSYSTQDTNYGGIAEANTMPYGHSGSVNGGSNNYKALSAGGVGYGAGGGTSLPTYGSYNLSWGGSSGVIADANYVLPDTNEIAVTVGAGGAGYGYNPSDTYRGGGGANGCVAVWW